MREARLMIIVSFCLFISLGPIFYLLHILYPNLIDYMNVATNLYCGIIVGLVASICQFCSSKVKIKNTIYNAYFDVYRSFYYSKNKTFLWHYNAYNVYKKMAELNLKIVEALDNYYGLLKKYDNTYKKLNPNIKLNNSYKAKNLLKAFFQIFNKKSFNNFFGPLMNEVEHILTNIDKKRFEKDKIQMIKLYEFLCNNKKVTFNE